MEKNMAVPQKTQCGKTNYEPAIPLLGTQPDKNFIEKDTYTPCSLQPDSQQPRHGNNLNIHQQMKGLRRCGIYIYIMEYYSAIKKNKIMSFAATWMELETLILNEVSQKEKDKYHISMISLISGI